MAVVTARLKACSVLAVESRNFSDFNNKHRLFFFFFLHNVMKHTRFVSSLIYGMKNGKFSLFSARKWHQMLLDVNKTAERVRS